METTTIEGNLNTNAGSILIVKGNLAQTSQETNCVHFQRFFTTEQQQMLEDVFQPMETP